MDDNTIEQQVTKAVDEAMKKLKSDGIVRPPKTFYEFIWQGAQTFGIPAVAFGVILLIIYQTFPAWVQANIDTQTSLSENLDRQTDNLVKLGSTLQDLQAYGRETELFRKEVTIDHAKMATELKEVKAATDTLCLEQARQREEHKAIVETLKLLCTELKNPS